MHPSKKAFHPESMRRARERGSVLFEILVSAVVLTAVCLVVMRALTGCLRTLHMLEDRSAAALAIDDALWKMDLAHGEFSAGDAQAPAGFQQVAWEVLETPLAQTDLSPLLRQRALTLRWSSSSLTLSAYYAQPNSSGS